MIGIFTYPVPHRKTQDLLPRLLHAYPDDEFCLILSRWKYIEPRKTLLYHRPMFQAPHTPADLADLYGVNVYDHVPDCELYVVGGCGIIDTKDRIIINGHPGYLPNVRGLDALKWAIYEGQPMGVTTHILSEQVDLGTIIERKILEPDINEGFISFANRIYAVELDMITNSIGLYRNKQFDGTNIDTEDRRYEVHKRMPFEKEMIVRKKYQDKYIF